MLSYYQKHLVYLKRNNGEKDLITQVLEKVRRQLRERVCVCVKERDRGDYFRNSPVFDLNRDWPVSEGTESMLHTHNHFTSAHWSLQAKAADNL